MTKHSFYLSLSLCTLLSSISFADHNKYDCQEYPGRSLCLQMNVVRSYIGDCVGTSCYPSWKKYIVALNDFTRFYASNFLPQDKYAEDVGDMAFNLASLICRQEYQGEAEWISALTTAENRALRPLKEIQESADLPVQKFCKKTTN